MAQTIPDITIGDAAWVDVNTESGIIVGSKMFITLKSSSWCRIYEGATPPTVDSKDGQVLTDKRYPYNTATIPAASLKIWAISADKGRTAGISVQEI